MQNFLSVDNGSLKLGHQEFGQLLFLLGELDKATWPNYLSNANRLQAQSVRFGPFLLGLNLCVEHVIVYIFSIYIYLSIYVYIYISVCVCYSSIPFFTYDWRKLLMSG